MPEMKPSVFITGGCGFIGTWVIRELLRIGLRVIVLDTGGRPPRWKRVIGSGGEAVPLVQGSLLDRELLTRVFAEHDVTHVIHLAALLTPDCQADPWEGCRVNVLGTVALFEQVRASANRIHGFSSASSVAVFGDEPDHASGAPMTGSHPLTFYGAFKKSVELIADQYWRQFQITSVGIRPQIAYGPEREAGLTAGPSLAARAAAQGEAYCIRYTGHVGYDYVEDVARAFVRSALETPPGAPVIDLPGEVADVNQVIAAIATAAPESARNLSANGPPIPRMPHPRRISSRPFTRIGKPPLSSKECGERSISIESKNPGACRCDVSRDFAFRLTTARGMDIPSYPPYHTERRLNRNSSSSQNDARRFWAVVPDPRGRLRIPG
ncbi:MAG: NAD(P)-dependent oxidoreductase [Pedosphaera sp.]|nr:NAD(P)-dependent oxidoreductase [Pedosphaera sp.]